MTGTITLARSLDMEALRSNAAWTYLFDLSLPVREPTEEEAEQYAQRHADGTYDEMLGEPGTKDLPAPALGPDTTPGTGPVSRTGWSGEPQTPGSNAQDEGRAFGGLNNAPDLPGPDAPGSSLGHDRAGEPDELPALTEAREAALDRFHLAHDEQDAAESAPEGQS
jgi:hypothetical protein